MGFLLPSWLWLSLFIVVVGVLGVLQLESLELRHQLQGLGYLIIPFYHKTTYCQKLHS